MEPAPSQNNRPRSATLAETMNLHGRTPARTGRFLNPLSEKQFIAPAIVGDGQNVPKLYEKNFRNWPQENWNAPRRKNGLGFGQKRMRFPPSRVLPGGLAPKGESAKATTAMLQRNRSGAATCLEVEIQKSLQKGTAEIQTRLFGPSGSSTSIQKIGTARLGFSGRPADGGGFGMSPFICQTDQRFLERGSNDSIRRTCGSPGGSCAFGQT